MTQPIQRSTLGESRVETAAVPWEVGRLWGRKVGNTTALATRAKEGWAEVLHIADFSAALEGL